MESRFNKKLILALTGALLEQTFIVEEFPYHEDVDGIREWAFLLGVFETFKKAHARAKLFAKVKISSDDSLDGRLRTLKSGDVTFLISGNYGCRSIEDLNVSSIQLWHLRIRSLTKNQMVSYLLKM